MSERARLVMAAASGAGIGAIARWLLAVLIEDHAAGDFPLATLIANGSGSFIIGVAAALATSEGHVMAKPAVRQFVMVGFCGGLTTFSIFSLEALTFIQASQPALATAYLIGSVAVWLCAVWSGFALARRLVSSKAHQSAG
jgi:CrcB protein